MTPKRLDRASQELGIGLSRLRSDPTTWPWPARLDYYLSTRPLIEMVVTGPQGNLGGFFDWQRAVRQIFTTTFLTARGRAWLRYQWDVKHGGGCRTDLRRRFDALNRLDRIQSRYWLCDWYLDDER